MFLLGQAKKENVWVLLGQIDYHFIIIESQTLLYNVCPDIEKDYVNITTSVSKNSVCFIFST